MGQRTLTGISLIAHLWLWPVVGFGQQVKNVPEAFRGISQQGEVITLINNLKVPTDGGHLQGVQVIEKDGMEKLLISGSSLTQAYILQVDIATKKADRFIPLMKEPYRHAGGIQVSADYIVVGIEDNIIKTAAKVCLYDYRNDDLYDAQSSITIERTGEVERPTAGATGLLAMEGEYLMVVGNWNSRNWDFYYLNLEKYEQKLMESFAAPDEWAAYQSINLIMDEQAIYAIGFYQTDPVGAADLILVRNKETVELVMQKIDSKTFKCTNGVDFATAAGLQVDQKGDLHIWGTQRDALERIVVNKFSQQ
ncbi:MAG: hypothetical protein DHS20C17_20880 [Cyclobacteriaceae bacterium]|nr:MAG: hypothetical protein DHS20C17_20880 [Cyclobacteriaceae bacterium]